ncbi:MAG: J domain-containing protein [Ktedonobacteraceae bacterium]
MNTFTDYYAVLGIDPQASASSIKAAFKKLALQYHPDVYKGEDAQERMRTLLQAYQTLNDPAERKVYDARRSEHVLGASSPRGYVAGDMLRSSTQKAHLAAEVSPTARRDRQRHYSFPDVTDEPNEPNEPDKRFLHLDLGDLTYDLTTNEVRTLRQEGMLRGIDREIADLTQASPVERDTYPLHCHRCHHRWTIASLRGRSPTTICPSCNAKDWAEYLLLRCTHCHAVFESEQIRYEVGAYNYGDGNETLCPPYELFPLCPYCGASGWCPAEDARVATLRAAAGRAALLRIVWASAAVVVFIVLGFVALNVLR